MADINDNQLTDIIELKELVVGSSIAGRVRNTRLPATKPLWPMFEAISNSIHSIEEKEEKSGIVEVRLIRQGDSATYKQMTVVDTYPITGMTIVDNGVGFNERNFKSFLTADSDYKIEKGAKGIGRFVCLKAFKAVRVDSIYHSDDKKYHRKFDFKSEGGGIFDYFLQEHQGTATGTRVSLLDFRDDFQKKCPLKPIELSQKVVEHFLVHFLMDNIPKIKIVDANGDIFKVNSIYDQEIKPTIKKGTFDLNGETFTVHLVKIYLDEAKHEIHYCANGRDVSMKSLGPLIQDLGKRIEDEKGETFVYHAYVTSAYLDENVNPERTGFTHPQGTEEEEKTIFEITQMDIQRGTVSCVESILSTYLDEVRDKKFDHFAEFARSEAPQFMSLLKHRPEKINSIAANIDKSKLNIELYRIQSEWEQEVRLKGEEFLKPKSDITDTEQYKRNYEEYIEELNDIGKANLAKYIVHRKAVIELLESYLNRTEDEKYLLEDAIHNIFFPIRSYSDDISYDKQNLWLIDERLAYHNYLASDKTFNSINQIQTNSNNNDRTDLLIYNDAFIFTNEEAPYRSFTIVEFKRPERDDYSMKKEKDNPIDQIQSYIQTIRDSKAETKNGKLISVGSENIQFHCYIVCDFNPALDKIAEAREFKRTPDGEGFFKFHTPYNAYIEIISYSKLLKDSKKRNKILFDHLNLPH